MELSCRRYLTKKSLQSVPQRAGVYVIYDLAGPIYVGRSAVNIRRRLLAHFEARGNKNIALARRVGALETLTFAYCCMPVAAQREVEAVLIRHLDVTAFANLRREACPEDWPREWSRLATQALAAATR